MAASADTDSLELSQLRPERPDDGELVVRLRLRDDAALRLLMDRHAADLARYFSLRCRDRSAVEDLVNETFYRIYAKAHTYRCGEPFRAWFYAVAANVWRASLRRRRLPQVTLESVPEPGAPAGPAEAGAAMESVLAAMPELDREILRLKHYEGMKLKDIAARLGLSAGAVYTRLYRAVHRLREGKARDDSV